MSAGEPTYGPRTRVVRDGEICPFERVSLACWQNCSTGKVQVVGLMITKPRLDSNGNLEMLLTSEDIGELISELQWAKDLLGRRMKHPLLPEIERDDPPRENSSD